MNMVFGPNLVKNEFDQSPDFLMIRKTLRKIGLYQPIVALTPNQFGPAPFLIMIGWMQHRQTKLIDSEYIRKSHFLFYFMLFAKGGNK